jgi:hypothetical protein
MISWRWREVERNIHTLHQGEIHRVLLVAF